MITVNKKWIRLIGIVGCTVWMASCKQAPDAGVKSSYAVMQIEPTDKELSSSYSATIRGRQDIDIYPQVSGTIEKLCVTEGQKVRRGQLLFIIDQVPYRAVLKTATANVEAARAATSTAELTYKSNKELYAQKVVSEFSLKTAENSYLTAKAQLAQAEAQEISARNNLSYTEVKSPSDGVVGALPYRAGALVSANIPYPLTTVSDNSDMYVYFSMTENQLLALTRQYGDILGEVHAASLVQAALVDGTHSHPVLFELADEELFVVQQIELVGVERLFSERIEQKIFHAEIVVDSEKVKAEMSRYEKIPVIAVFTDAEVNDRMDETIKQNYDHIKDETSQIVEKKAGKVA